MKTLRNKNKRELTAEKHARTFNLICYLILTGRLFANFLMDNARLEIIDDNY